MTAVHGLVIFETVDFGRHVDMIWAVVLIAALFGDQSERVTTNVAVAGAVQDQTGAVLAGARVELIDASGTAVETTADAVGARTGNARAGDTVSNAAVDVTVASAGNVDAVTVDAATLDSLPIFDRDYVATLSRFLDTGSLGNAGATVVVNGMEVAGLNVSASAFSQIRINQDPYSAEYSRLFIVELRGRR